MREEDGIKVLRKIFNSDKWFGALYDAVFYQEVDDDITVYVNGVHLLRKELANLDCKPLISIGATCEPYFSLEKDYHLVSRGLEVINEFNMSVVVVTGQDLILRDLNILEKISEHRKAWVVFKMDKYDISLLEAAEIVSARGIKTGIMAKSSFIFNEDYDLVKRFLNEAKNSGCNFILPMHLLENSYVQDDYEPTHPNQEEFYKLCDEIGISNKMPLFDEEMMFTKQIDLFSMFN